MNPEFGDASSKNLAGSLHSHLYRMLVELRIEEFLRWAFSRF